MSYLDYWKLQRSPFGGSATQPIFFEGGSVHEAIARTAFLVEHERQLGIVVGSQGIGKTMLLRGLKKHLTETVHHRMPVVAYVSAHGLRKGELPSRIIASLNQADAACVAFARAHAEQGWQSLHDCLLSLLIQRQRMVLLIDDVDYLSQLEWDDMQRLLQWDDRLTCIFSIAEEHFLALISCLRDRCELRIDLPEWDLGQTADYFEFCMTKVRASDRLFEAQAITRVQELSNGIPRRINQIGELCLVAGAVRQAERITSSLVEIAVEELPLMLESDLPDDLAAA